MAQVKEVKGPGPRRMGGPKPKVENPGKLLKRIMDEVFKHYLPHCILVLVCIIVSALANVQASLFLCASSFSPTWKACPSGILTPTPTATSCRCTPTMWTPCAR